MSDDADRVRMGAGLAELFEAATAGSQIDLIASRSAPSPTTAPSAPSGCAATPAPTEPEVSRPDPRPARRRRSAAPRSAREAFVTVVVREETHRARTPKRAGRGVTGRARILYGVLGRGRGTADRRDRLHPGQLAGQRRPRGRDPHRVRTRRRTRPGRRGDPPPRRPDTIAAGVPVAAAGPTNASTAMRSYRHGEWESISSTILLPRKGAVMGALARALVPSQLGERRALTVFYRPVVTAGRRPHHRPGRDVGRDGGRDAPQGRHASNGPRTASPSSKLHETDEKLETGPLPGEGLLRGLDHRPRRLERPGLRPPPGRRRSACAASRRCRSTAPTTPRSPPPPSRSGPACPRSAAKAA